MSPPRPAESWVLGGQQQQNESLGGPRQEREHCSFLWVSGGHHREVNPTSDGPLNPGRAFLLVFLGEGAPGLSGDCSTGNRWQIPPGLEKRK